MPFRIDVLDAALTPERQAALAYTLVRDGKVEIEVAELVSAMTPGTVAEVATVVERERLISALTRVGFDVRVASTAGSAPAAIAPRVTARTVRGEAPRSLVRSITPTLLISSGLLAAVMLVVALSGEAAPEDVDTTVIEAPAAPVEATADSMETMSEGVMMESEGDASYRQAWITSSPTGYVNVRSWGSINAPVTDQVNNGNMIYTDRCDYAPTENKTWCRTNVNGAAGWIGQVNLRVVNPSGTAF